MTARRLSSREQRLLLAVGLPALTILYLYSAFLVGPLLRDVGTLGKQVRESRAELHELETATANEAALRGTQRQLQEAVVSLRGLLPAEGELPRVIELLSKLAMQSQVRIQTIFPQPPRASTLTTEGSEPVVYKEVLIQVEAVSGFHQLGTFLSRMESGETPMQVSSLRIFPGPKDPRRMNVKLTVQAYFATTDTVEMGEERS